MSKRAGKRTANTTAVEKAEEVMSMVEVPKEPPKRVKVRPRTIYSKTECIADSRNCRLLVSHSQKSVTGQASCSSTT